MGYYEFPHTRNYDTDLGYLIKRYFELNADFESLEKNFNDLKAWCIAQLNSEALKTLVANKLDEWLQDGTLASLINDPLLHITTYDTVVEMIAHSGLESGSKIYCTGANTINDGNGGHFRVRERLTSDIIDNYHLYLIDGGIKVAERINEQMIYYITPQMYGAKGDGKTDDTVAFQNAINYAQNNQTELFIPKGTYIITGTLIINKKVKIRGEVQPNLFQSYDCVTIKYIANDVHKPLFNISNGLEPYTWNDNAKRVHSVDISNLNLDAWGVENKPHCAIWTSTTLSNFENIKIDNFFIGIAMTYTYESSFNTIRIANSEKCIIMSHSAPETLLNNCWLTYNNDVFNGQDTVSNESVINIYKPLSTEISNKYTGLTTYQSERVHIENCAIEATAHAIENVTTTIFGVNTNIERIKEYIVKQVADYTSQNAQTVTRLVNTQFYQDAHTCSLGNISFNTLLHVDIPMKFPDNITAVEKTGHCACEYYSAIDGYYVEPISIKNTEGGVIPIAINNSHFEDNFLIGDLILNTFTNWQWDTYIEIPETYYDLNNYDIRIMKDRSSVLNAKIVKRDGKRMFAALAGDPNFTAAELSGSIMYIKFKIRMF